MMPVHGIERPCGKCLACRIAKCREWEIRLVHENCYHEKSGFVTLTYDDQHIPKDGSVSKRELQLFMKRLRKDSEVSLRYFACGEYGDRTGRPHYHLIVFGQDVEDHEEDPNVPGLIIDGPWLEAWGKGGVYGGTVTSHSIRYCTDYIFKAYDNEKSKEVYGEKQPPFKLISKGLGRQWVYENQQYLHDNLKITYRGVPIALPRYYLDKMDGDKVSTSWLRAQNEYEARAAKLKRLAELGITGPDLEEYKLSSRYQRDLELRARRRLMAATRRETSL